MGPDRLIEHASPAQYPHDNFRSQSVVRGRKRFVRWANVATHLLVLGHGASTNMRHATLQAIADRLNAQQGWFERIEIAGPGFINLTLSGEAIVRMAAAMFDDPRLGVDLPERADRVAIDYGSPNLAKEMHIGHLRSTIIGDAIVRILRFAGHEVLIQNHIGDWGTPFGMLLENLIDKGWDQAGDHSLSDLNRLYEEARARFDAEPAFAERSRQRVVRLQGGDAESLAFWKRLIAESCGHMNEVFRRLGFRV